MRLSIPIGAAILAAPVLLALGALLPWSAIFPDTGDAGQAMKGSSAPQAESASPAENSGESDPLVHTFSIVAHDPKAGEWGVAVQSKFIAVGAVVPFAKAGVGAVATQSFANTSYGPEGLKLLEEGKTSAEVVEALTSKDNRRTQRQLGIIDAKGKSATYTGQRCMVWAGGKTGPNYAVQGNILAGKEVIDGMATAFENGKGDLGDRMIAALAAGQKAGGDKRGKQSAALLIVRKGAGYAGQNDRYRDLRVDDHTNPITELARVYGLHKKVFPPPKTE